MIRSLEDANEWYNAVKELALDMQHLASRCDEPEWEAVMRRDNRLGTRSAAELNKEVRPRREVPPRLSPGPQAGEGL